MAGQQAILESIQDEAEVKANWELIRQKQTEAGTLFDELDTEIAMEEAGVEQPESSEGTELQLRCMYPLKGMEIVDISEEE
ncbi:hypothetical protein D1007_54882 [Hordeum vulgare]|nr:hypothetical protein D1007_54882 [Hordeum vulgare]